MMKAIKLLFLLIFSGILFAPVAASADPAQTADQRLVGIWEEYKPSSNFVQFFPDHTMRLYLTQEEGSGDNMHWIGGKWSITASSVLVVEMSANGKTMTRQYKLVFDKKEMVMIDDDGTETRHRRHTGEIPEKYRW